MNVHTILYSAAIVLVIAVVTAFTRFVPFVIFSGQRKVPAYIVYLGAAMPAAVIAMLIVYCLRNTAFSVWPFGIPEGIACVVTAMVHWFGKNTLVSIVTGTVLYMVLVQMVFI
ncbi:MAG: branched-chain amino acid transporter permease [Intestinibacillus sp.]